MLQLLVRISGILSVGLLITAGSISAQNMESCGTMEFYKDQIQIVPGFKDSIAKSEALINEWIQKNANRKTRAIYKIPVVVHVVYNINHPEQNVSDWQIQSQIDVLNEDFRRKNGDTSLIPAPFRDIAADCDIEFCLAKRDPLNRPTNGIIRAVTTVDMFSNLNAVKSSSTGGDNGWTKDKYLNIWVCNVQPPTIGFATFPGNTNVALDGIVIHYAVLGRYQNTTNNYNLGRTCTHEVGHWLDLHHIWGDNANGCNDSDYVEDTPNQDSAVYGCASFPHKSCGNDGDMTMNYMNYAYDQCMSIFSQGQKQRMLAALHTQRGAILNSDACNPVKNHLLDAGISGIYFSEANANGYQINPVVTISNYGLEAITDMQINFRYYRPNVMYAPVQWTGYLPAGESTDVTLPQIMTQNPRSIFIAYTSLPNGRQDMDTSNDFRSFRSFKISNVPVASGRGEVLTVYPNPVFGSVTLEIDSLNLSAVSVELYNIMGQQEEISTAILPDNKLILETALLPPGMYMLRVKTREETLVQKFIKASR